MLIKRYETSGFVFSRNGTHLTQHYSCKKLYQACKGSGLRKIGWHKLRHTFASHLAQNNISIQVIKELLGHADITTTMQYAHLNPSVLIGAIETLEPKITKPINFGHNMVTLDEIKAQTDKEVASNISDFYSNNKQKQTSWSVSVL